MMQMMHLRSPCDHCKQSVSYSADQAGKRVQCPKCKQVFRLPPLETLESAEAFPPILGGFHINTKPPVRMPKAKKLWVAVAFVGLVIAGILVSAAWSGFQRSPSERLAKERRERISKAKNDGNIFAALAEADLPEKSIDVRIIEGEISVGTGIVGVYDNYIKPVAEGTLKIKNNSNVPIKDLTISLQFLGENRSIPYSETTVIIEIPGGVEAGEVLDVEVDSKLPKTEFWVYADGNKWEPAKAGEWLAFIETVSDGSKTYTVSQEEVTLKPSE